MVVTSVFSTAETGSTHDGLASPLTCTVQAPHWAAPQPNFVPFMPSTSRKTQSSGMSGGTSTFTDLPLTLKLTVMVSSHIFSATWSRLQHRKYFHVHRLQHLLLHWCLEDSLRDPE